MSKAPNSAPLTLSIIVQLNQAMSLRGLTREDLRVMVNKYLPESRQVRGTHAGIVKLNRWMNPDGSNWPEPQSEISLAFQKVLADLIQKNS